MDPIADLGASLILGVLDGCGGWIAGLTLIFVGLINVRKAHATAGYLVGGAGALQLLASCCYSVPVMLVEAGAEEQMTVGLIVSRLGLLATTSSIALLIFAAVTLSRRITSTSGAT